MQKIITAVLLLVFGILILTLLFEKGDFQASKPSASIVDEAIDQGATFLKGALAKGNFSMKCSLFDLLPCPVDRSGRSPLSFFIIDAIGEELGREQTANVLSWLLSEKQDGLWGYSIDSPVDADDTAFALRVFKILNASIEFDSILEFYDSEAKGFKTFLIGNQSANLVFEPRASNSGQMHPEVNANAYLLFLDSPLGGYINYNLTLASQDPEGYWYSYFYPSKYYSTYLNLELICSSNLTSAGLKDAQARGVAFILKSQNGDGSWGDPGNAYETALALNALASCSIFNGQFEKGVQFLLKEQMPDDSWGTTKVIWEFHYEDDPPIVWRGYDESRIMTTSLVVKALKRAAGSGGLQG
jgi:hypothetical protein